MGGDAGVISTVGEGSTFWFTVALKQGTGSQARQDAAIPNAELKIAAQYAGCLVLVVEDEQVNRELMETLLTDVGLTIDLAEDGLSAIAFAKESLYDLILMDVQMPKMDGITATQHIRCLPHYDTVPILATTANAFVEDRQRCLDAGMDDYIAKPITPSELYSTILKWLEKNTTNQN